MAERVLFGWESGRLETYDGAFYRVVYKGSHPATVTQPILLRALLAALDEVTDKYREARDREAVTERELEDTRAALDEERAKAARLRSGIEDCIAIAEEGDDPARLDERATALQPDPHRRHRREERSMNGAELIAAERQRQVEEEGWTPEHDAEHRRGEMAIAAACYAVHGTDAHVEYPDGLTRTDAFYSGAARGWPWLVKSWKPKDQIRDLVRAGALIAAEIDRLSADAEGRT